MNEIERMQRQVFQRMSPECRLKMGLEMTADGLRSMDLRLCQQMPENSQGERMAARFEALYKNDLPPDVLQACLEGLRKHWKERLHSLFNVIKQALNQIVGPRYWRCNHPEAERESA